MIRVRLIKKPAAVLNGVDVSRLKIGDILELPETAARIMVAEGWAEPADHTPSPLDQTAARAARHNGLP